MNKRIVNIYAGGGGSPEPVLSTRSVLSNVVKFRGAKQASKLHSYSEIDIYEKYQFSCIQCKRSKIY